MRAAFTDARLAALAALPSISRDPIDGQAVHLIEKLERYSFAVARFGPTLDPGPVTDAASRYELVAKLYAPSLVAELARQLLEARRAAA